VSCFGQEKDVPHPYVAVLLDTTRIITTSVSWKVEKRIERESEIERKRVRQRERAGFDRKRTSPTLMLQSCWSPPGLSRRQ
jgi:hypothetical protein